MADCPVVKYNNYTFPLVMGPYTFSHTPTDLKFSCSFLLTAASSADLIAAELAMLAKVKEVKKDFYLSFNGTKEFDLSHGNPGGTGFNSRATVTKTQHNGLSTELTRQFNLVVTLELPYTQDNGRISAEMAVSYSPAKQATANFVIVYSASTTKNALAVYNDDTWVATMLAAIFTGGEVMEKTGSSWTQDQNQKRITVRETYTQVLFPASLNATVESKVVRANLTYSLAYLSQTNALLTSPDAREYLPVLELNLSYQSFFDKSLLSSANEIADLWRTNLRGRLLSQVTDILKLTYYASYTSPTFYIKNETVQVNASDFSLVASMVVGVRAAGTHIVFLEESIQIALDEGYVKNKLWDGVPNTYAIFTTGSTLTLSRTLKIAQLMFEPVIPAMPTNYLLSSGNWLRERHVWKHDLKFLGFKYSGSGGDSGASEKVPLHTVVASELYTCVDTANSVQTIIGTVSSQTTTG